MQRRNLATVARMLQLAASGKFEDAVDNSRFLEGAWDRFVIFLDKATDVSTPEKFFNIDEYSDVTMLTKPAIFISHAEIFYTHELLIENMDEVAPSMTDPLREILSDLGEVGAEDYVLGEEGSEQLQNSQGNMSLQLTNKFEIPEEDDMCVPSP